MLEALESGQRPLHQLQNLVHDIETEALQLALDLTEIEVAEGCDGCPAAPPTTRAQTHLCMLADELERQAELARKAAQASSHSDRDRSG